MLFALLASSGIAWRPKDGKSEIDQNRGLKATKLGLAEDGSASAERSVDRSRRSTTDSVAATGRGTSANVERVVVKSKTPIG